MKDEDKKPPRHVGVDADHSISFDMQFEIEKILAETRMEKDPTIIKNGLFDAINKMVATINKHTDNKDIQDKLQKEMDLLDSDELSPKTEITHLDDYHMKYDSYSVRCGPNEYDVTLDHLDRDLERVTIRRLWAMFGRIQIIAYKENIFHESYTLRGPEKDVR